MYSLVGELLNMARKKKSKKVNPSAIMAARKKALQNAVDKGYITKEDFERGMKIPLKKEKPKPKPKPKPRILYGLNTNSM